MIDQTTRANRVTALRASMAAKRVDVVAIAPTDNLRYLIGFSPLPDERACMLLISAGGAAMVMPSLNAEQTASEAPEIELVRWSDDAGPQVALGSALEKIDGNGAATIAVDPEMRTDHLLVLQAGLPQARTIDAASVIGPLRTIKDSTELALLQQAANAADAAMLAGIDAIKPGLTEMQVYDVIAARFAENDSAVDFAIVGSGPNGAYPHHHTGTRVLQDGDAIVLDIGGVRDGYVSDMTRMAYIGEPTARYLEVHEIVEQAVQAAMAAAKPGASCGDVDAAARGVITDAGYGEYFVHRTGHGLGISTHEQPWIMADNDTVLEVGNVHSIEPGIYLPGEFGVRLEDIVHITEHGCERFSSLPRELRIIG
jgi:Xaa-Pro aminopeptidase